MAIVDAGAVLGFSRELGVAGDVVEMGLQADRTAVGAAGELDHGLGCTRVDATQVVPRELGMHRALHCRRTADRRP
jgi:hypothetical protein